VVEDLGGGMQAVGQFDLRIALDAVGRTSNFGTTTPAVNPLPGGNQHVGLRSSWGSIKLGRQDTHYGNSGDTITGKAGHLGAHNASLFDCVQRPGVGQACIANLSRAANMVWYDSPKWGGFTFMVGMSTNATRVSTTQDYENDLGTTNRKGRAWTFNPVYNGGNWEIAWSHWNSKSDWTGGTPSIATVTQASLNPVSDEKADSLRGHFIWGGLRVGLGLNRSKTNNALTGQMTGKRSAWSLPISYNWGPHTVYGTYTKAGNTSCDTSVAACAGAPQSSNGARLLTLAYNYDLSKRTSVGVTYINLRNQANGAYSLFYQGDSAFGGTGGGSLAGEDWRLWGVSLRHNF
jgi:predicted porin